MIDSLSPLAALNTGWLIALVILGAYAIGEFVKWVKK